MPKQSNALELGNWFYKTHWPWRARMECLDIGGGVLRFCAVELVNLAEERAERQRAQLQEHLVKVRARAQHAPPTARTANYDTSIDYDDDDVCEICGRPRALKACPYC